MDSSARKLTGTLASVSPLLGFSKSIAGTTVSEVNGLVILSVAVPKNELSELNHQLQAQLGLSFPVTGKSVSVQQVRIDSITAGVSLLGLQSDQCLLIAQTDESSRQSLQHAIFDKLKHVAYLTDQSDTYAVLDIEGPNTLSALERICALDLTRFETSDVSRTLMEHLQVIVQKPKSEKVRLFSPRSSADSFLHAVVTSLENVAPAVAPTHSVLAKN